MFILAAKITKKDESQSLLLLFYYISVKSCQKNTIIFGREQKKL